MTRGDLLALGAIGALALAGSRGRRVGARNDETFEQRLRRLERTFLGVTIKVIPEGTKVWFDPDDEDTFAVTGDRFATRVAVWPHEEYTLEAMLPRPAILAAIAWDDPEFLHELRDRLRTGLRRGGSRDPEDLDALIREAGFDGSYDVETVPPDFYLRLFRTGALPIKRSSISGDRFVQSMGLTW